MKSILFITGNKRKIWQATDILKPFDIEVNAQDLEVTEIQSTDPIAVSIAKAKTAYEMVKQPLMICDHSWAIPALKGFPGVYMKDINHWFEPEDFLALMRDKQDKSLIFTETVVYIDGEQLEKFSAEFPAHFINEPRGKGVFSQERVVMYDGQDETIAERIDKHEHARDPRFSAYAKFGEWFVKQ